MPFLDEIGFLIDAAGIATLDQDLFLSRMAKIPTVTGGARIAPITTIRETGGASPDYIQNSLKPHYLKPGAQITTRATRYVDARAVVQSCFDLLGSVWNRQIGSAFYLHITPTHDPSDDLGMDGSGLATCVLNFTALKGPSGALPVAYKLIDVLGGDRFGFAAPAAVSDQYPSGSTDDVLVPGSNAVLLDGSQLPVSYYLEATARQSAAGPNTRVKIALFDLDAAPNTPILGSEIVFGNDQLVGQTMRSALFQIPVFNGIRALGLGAKITMNDTVNQPAGWGIRVILVM